MTFLNRQLTGNSLMDGRQIFNAVVNNAITKQFRKSHPGNQAGHGSEFRAWATECFRLYTIAHFRNSAHQLHRKSNLSAALCWLSQETRDAFGQTNQETDPGNQRELFIDDHLIGEMKNMQLLLHSPVREESLISPTALKYDSITEIDS